MTADLLHLLAEISLVGAVTGCLYLALVILLIRYYQDSRSVPEGVAPGVSVLVPLCGPEPDLAQRLRALRRQDYPAPVQIVCGVLDPHDPAIAEVESASADRLPHGIDLHVDTRINGRNLKVANLINMMSRARHDTLILIDSDIEVAPDYLRAVVSALQQADVGAVTCLYDGVTKGGTWARLAAAEINLHFLPNVVFALSLNLARPCFGSTIAMSRETLRRIGGFQAFMEQLWDDYAIGEAVRGLGQRIAIPSFTVGHVCTESSGRTLFDRQLRFARTIKSIDPVGYLGGIVTNPLPLALISFMSSGGSLALVIALIAVVCRIGVARAVERRFGVEASPLLLVPVLDCLSFAVYATSFFSTSVLWRGQRYRIASDGTMIPRTD